MKVSERLLYRISIILFIIALVINFFTINNGNKKIRIMNDEIEYLVHQRDSLQAIIIKLKEN